MVETVVVSSSWPIIVLICPPVFDASWIGGLEPSFRDVFARQQHFALITDTSNVTTIPAARERRLLGDWASRADQLALQRRWNVGSSTIVKGALMRGTLQALYWMWTPAAPQHAARDFDEAWGWCVSMLERRAIALPADPTTLRRLAERDMARLRSGSGRGPDSIR